MIVKYTKTLLNFPVLNSFKDLSMISKIGGTVCNTVFNQSVCSQGYGNALGWVVLTGTSVLGIVSVVALKRLSLPWNNGTKTLAGRPIDQFINNFQRYCGIKAEDIGICDGWVKVDKSLPVLDADKFLHLDPSLLRKFALDPLPPISFTFKGALRFVIKLIEERPTGGFLQAHEGHQVVYLTRYGKNGRLGLESQFLHALRSIFTQNRLVNENFNKNWLGVILRLLMQEGIITDYGGKHDEIWVQLPL